MKRASLIKKIALEWDLWIGQYRAYFPSNAEEAQDCQKLIQQAGTFDGTLNEGIAGKANTQMVACQDTRTGAIIAALRMADAYPFREVPGKAEQYGLDVIPEERLMKVAIFTQMAIHPDYEKTEAALVLISHCFVEVLKAEGHAALMSCDPGHYSIYKRLGMRPIGGLSKTPEGFFRIPMILIPDQDYLSIIHSPILSILRGVDFEAYQPICQWYYQLVRENTALQAGSAFYPDNEEDFGGHHTITEGLSENGREAFLKNALVIKCREGEVLITENDGGKSFGYVQKGIVNVVIGNKTLVILGEGDIFGEIAFILHTKRSAQVVAASSETEVVLFSESALNELENEADKAIIWRNLARVLAQRVVVTNKLLSGK